MEEKTIMMADHLHTYQDGNRTCEVYLAVSGGYATRHYKKIEGGSVWQKDVLHKGKSEVWAENAAENWVMKLGES